MRQSVRDAFVPFSAPLEGVCTWLYLDAAMLATTGLGHLCNSFAEVAMLPWKRPDGSLCTRDEVAADYAKVRAHEDWHLRGGGAYEPLTTMRLTREDVVDLAMRKLASNETILEKRWPDFQNWPADAQLALHSWAWGVGPSANYPLFAAALRRGDFAEAAEHVKMTLNGVEIGTLKIRNLRNQLLLRNAQRVRAFGLDPERLYWPTDVATLVEAAETLPELPVVEDDLGASRRAATTDAVMQAAKDSVEKDQS